MEYLGGTFGLLAALLSLAAVIAVSYFLLSRLMGVATMAAGTVLTFALGVVIGVLTDLRIVTLLTVIFAILSWYEPFDRTTWVWSGLSCAIYMFVLSSVFILMFFRLKLSGRISDNPVLQRHFETSLKTGIGIWGVAGLIFAFSFVTFFAPLALKGWPFTDGARAFMPYVEALWFSLQQLAEAMPFAIAERFGIDLSQRRVPSNEYWAQAFIVAYQALLWFAVSGVALHIWNATHTAERRA